MKLTDKEIQDALAICDKATPGPWEWRSKDGHGIWAPQADRTKGGRARYIPAWVVNDEELYRDDGDFCIAARGLLPRALEEITRLHLSEKQMKEEVLEMASSYDAEVKDLQCQVAQLQNQLASAPSPPSPSPRPHVPIVAYMVGPAYPNPKVDFSCVVKAVDELVLKKQLADATAELELLRRLKDKVRQTVGAEGTAEERLATLIGFYDALFMGELDK